MATPESDFAEFRASRDAPALAAVFDALAPELLLVAAHLAPQGVEPEDLVQGTFLAAIARAASWDATRPLLPWLIGILVHDAQALGRQARRRLEPSRLRPRATPATPLDASAARELAERVAGAMAALPRHYRQVLNLQLVHGFSSAEVARALACPAATVRTRLQRGLERLRALLPAGLGACVAGVFAGRGLAAARETVLTKAAAVEVPATAVAMGAFGGVLLMTKVLVGACAVMIAAAVWMFWPRAPADATTPAVTRAAAAHMVPEAGEPAASVAATPEPTSASEAERTATTGALRVEFVWAEDSAPAGVLDVLLTRVEDDRELDESHLSTDRDGILSLSLLAPGRYRVAALEQTGGEADVVAGGHATLRVALTPLIDLTGIVVDDTGAPVAGAEVRAGGKDDARVLAVTRADGRFRWRGDRCGQVWAQREGWVPSELANAHGGVDLRLVLGARGHGVTGTVLDPDGVPVPDALVLISTVTRSVEAGLPTEQRRGPIVLRTDARGAFTTGSLAPGEQLALAVAKGFGPALQPITLPVDGEALVLRLCRGATVRGTVRLDGAPCKGVNVSAGPWPPPTRVEPIYGLLWPNAISDAQGRYELCHLLPGATRMLTSLRDLYTLPHDAELTEGEEAEWNPTLTIGLNVRGTVLDEHDAPVVGWRVYTRVRGSLPQSTHSDAAGRFVLAGVQPGPCRVEVAPPGGGEEVSTLAWAHAHTQAGADDVVLRIPARAGSGGYLTGRLMDASGSVPLGSMVTVYPSEGHDGPHWTQTIEPDGRFRLGPLPPARYQVHAERLEGSGVNQTLQVGSIPALQPGATLDLGALTFERRFAVNVRLRHRDGTLVRAARLAWEGPAGVHAFTQVGDGEWQSRPVPLGTYTLLAFGETFANVRRPIEVRADQPAPVEVTVEAGTPVRFVLRVPPAGPTVQPAHVSLTVLDGAHMVFGTLIQSDASPCVFTCGMAPGKYRAQAILDGPIHHAFASFTVPSDQREGLDVALDLLPLSETGR